MCKRLPKNLIAIKTAVKNVTNIFNCFKSKRETYKIQFVLLKTTRNISYSSLLLIFMISIKNKAKIKVS